MSKIIKNKKINFQEELNNILNGMKIKLNITKFVDVVKAVPKGGYITLKWLY